MLFNVFIYSVCLARYPVSQRYECQPQYDACPYIAGKSHDIAALQHLHALMGEGRESGEATAHPRREQQAPRAVCRPRFVE